jgi:hypothetical protein
MLFKGVCNESAIFDVLADAAILAWWVFWTMEKLVEMV